MSFFSDTDMNDEMTRRWSGIRQELDRLKGFDQNVYAEVVSLLRRVDFLETDNEELRSGLQGGYRANRQP